MNYDNPKACDSLAHSLKLQRFYESRHASQCLIDLHDKLKLLENILGDAAQLRVDLRRAGMCSSKLEEAVAETRQEKLRLTEELRDLEQESGPVMGTV